MTADAPIDHDGVGEGEIDGVGEARVSKHLTNIFVGVLNPLSIITGGSMLPFRITFIALLSESAI
jgi:hypothetical protein